MLLYVSSKYKQESWILIRITSSSAGGCVEGLAQHNYKRSCTVEKIGDVTLRISAIICETYRALLDVLTFPNPFLQVNIGEIVFMGAKILAVHSGVNLIPPENTIQLLLTQYAHHLLFIMSQTTTMEELKRGVRVCISFTKIYLPGQRIRNWTSNS